MAIEDMNRAMLLRVEDELRRVVESSGDRFTAELRSMLAYHMGWEGEGAGPQAQGKRIRPRLVLLTAAAAGGDWEEAVPAGAAVELLHNFSLIHDDIQDRSSLRRNRKTVWKRWGIAQAINAGDAMFVLSNLALLHLADTTTADIVLRAMQVMQRACLRLTQGQFLDLCYETRETVTLKDYWPMVEGKTASLLAACADLGALIAGAPADQRSAYREFGLNLGLAFQVQDDLLGIWGDAGQTGKPVDSDLVGRKKSLPVLFGLEQRGAFAEKWAAGSIGPGEVAGMAAQLEAEGARTFTAQTADRLTAAALSTLEAAAPRGEAGEALRALVNRLLGRTV